MKVKIKIDKDYEKPLCVIYTSEVSDEINEYLKLLSKSSEKTLTGRNGEDIVIIKPDEINNIYTANGKIFAVTSRGEYSVNTRLYKLEGHPIKFCVNNNPSSNNKTADCGVIRLSDLPRVNFSFLSVECYARLA